jgi:hypothetical protein
MRATILLAAVAFALIVAPVQAQSGAWVLVGPPIRQTGGAYLPDDTPIAKWSQLGAHDTAQSCEAERESLKHESLITLTSLGQPIANEDLGTEALRMVSAKMIFSRCVPYDLWWGTGK